MSKKQIITLILCFFFCVGVLLTLYAISPISGDIYRASFTRNIVDYELEEKVAIDLEYNSFYFAGVSDGKIYLGNDTAPVHLLISNLSLTDTSHIRLNINELDSITEPKRFRTIIDSPYFYMTHGTIPTILRGNINNWTAKPFMKDHGYYFVEAEPISHNSFILRSYHTEQKGYELAKKTIDFMYFNVDLLKKQIDGIFSLEGQILSDRTSNTVVYVHQYRNEIIAMDTNLNEKYRSHTIDTFSRAMIKVASIKNNGTTVMLSEPPIRTNGLANVSEKKLFVQSNLLAANEDMEEYLGNTIVDVYDLVDKCAYINSFYIPSYKGKKPRLITFHTNHIFALYDRYLIRYDFKSEMTSKKQNLQ